MVSAEVSTKIHNLVRVALLVSVLSLLVAGYSVVRSQDNPSASGITSTSQSSGESTDSSDSDLFLPPKDLADLIATVEQSVVAIECNGYGTGFALDQATVTDGFLTVIITNHHVIEDCIDSNYEIVVITGSEQKGRPNVELIDWDEDNDLAILEIDEYLPPLAESENYADRGWWTMAVGSPFDTDFEAVLYNSTTFGEISYVLNKYWNYTSATINGGNSGGPLVNSRGELIGINSQSGASTEGGVWNIAIDSAILCKSLYECTE